MSRAWYRVVLYDYPYEYTHLRPSCTVSDTSCNARNSLIPNGRTKSHYIGVTATARIHITHQFDVRQPSDNHQSVSNSLRTGSVVLGRFCNRTEKVSSVEVEVNSPRCLCYKGGSSVSGGFVADRVHLWNCLRGL